jgi:30S ribosomal protein S31
LLFYLHHTDLSALKNTYMGRGDKKTKKGKTFKGSFGKTRSSKTAKKTTAKKEA